MVGNYVVAFRFVRADRPVARPAPGAHDCTSITRGRRTGRALLGARLMKRTPAAFT